MDKKLLRQIERPKAKPEYLDRFAKDQDLRYLLDVKNTSGIIQITIFEKKHVESTQSNAKYRIFAFDNDYITQDLRVASTKWLTGQMISVLHIDYYRYSREKRKYYDFDFTEGSEGLMKERFGSNCEHVLDAFVDWQESVVAQKRESRHKAALSRTNYMMDKVPDIPENFGEWTYNYAMHNHRYLIYDADSSKRMRTAYCTHCQKHMQIDAKKYHLRNGEMNFCPECESQIRMKAYKKMKGLEIGHKNVSLIQKVEDMVLLRVFHVQICIRKTELPVIGAERTLNMSEVLRSFYTVNDAGYVSTESFEYGVYKSMKGNRWCPDESRYDISRAVVYTANLKTELRDTAYKYAGIEEYQLNEGCNEIPIWRYLKYYPKNQELEYVVKTKLTKLATDCLQSTVFNYKDSTVRFEHFLKDFRLLSKQNQKIMRSVNGGIDMMKLFFDAQSSGIQLTAQEMQDWLHMFGSDARRIRAVAYYHIHPRKLIRYARKQADSTRFAEPQLECNPAYCMNPGNRMERFRQYCMNLWKDWEDYMFWLRELKYNVNDDYYRFPKDFQEAHDRLMNEYEEMRNAEAKRKKEEMEMQVRKVLEDSTGDGFDFKTKHLMIAIPKNAEDIRREGRILHHCVSSYIERVAGGKTTILFVRKVTEPDTPYFTLEWKDGRIEQCRGMRNCNPPPDVKAFVKAFSKKMNEYANRKAVM